MRSRRGWRSSNLIRSEWTRPVAEPSPRSAKNSIVTGALRGPSEGTRSGGLWTTVTIFPRGPPGAAAALAAKSSATAKTARTRACATEGKNSRLLVVARLAAGPEEDEVQPQRDGGAEDQRDH